MSLVRVLTLSTILIIVLSYYDATLDLMEHIVADLIMYMHMLDLDCFGLPCKQLIVYQHVLPISLPLIVWCMRVCSDSHVLVVKLPK